MGTGITDVVGGPRDFLPPRSDEFQKDILYFQVNQLTPQLTPASKYPFEINAVFMV
jgi:hypothetical protein